MIALLLVDGEGGWTFLSNLCVNAMKGDLFITL